MTDRQKVRVRREITGAPRALIPRALITQLAGMQRWPNAQVVSRRPLSLALLSFNVFTACLPGDTRPTPGRAEVTITGDDSVRSAFITDDGWSVSFDEFFLSLGEVELEGDDCAQYSESDYLRIFDLRHTEPQRVNLVYALGSCQFSFRMQSPTGNTVLGTGVTERTKRSMRTNASDPYTENHGVVLQASGQATNASDTFRFEWRFRQDIEFSDCGVVEFSSASSQQLELQIRGAELFQSTFDDDRADLQFAAYANADENGDGDITLGELARVPLMDNEPFETLGARLYDGLLPRTVKWADGQTCTVTDIESD